MSEELQARFQRLVEGFNKRNVDAFDDIYANDCILHSPPDPDVKGLAAYKQGLADLFKGFPDVKETMDEFIGAEGKTVVRYTLRGTHTGQLPWLPIPPTGKEVVCMVCSVHHYAGGKCVERWEYMDKLGVLRQLGVIPAA